MTKFTYIYIYHVLNYVLKIYKNTGKNLGEYREKSFICPIILLAFMFVQEIKLLKKIKKLKWSFQPILNTFIQRK